MQGLVSDRLRVHAGPHLPCDADMWDRRVGGFNSKGEWGSGFSK
jgi:hypothetical protein